MVDQRFHRALHVLARGLRDLVIGRLHRAAAGFGEQLVDALLHDRRRLPHLFHADDGAVVTVAVLADGNVEFHLLVALVGLRFAQVPSGAGAAHHHAREAIVPAILERDDADVDVALLEDTVADEEVLEIVDDLQEGIAELADIFDELVRQVLRYAAEAEIIGVQARAAGALVEHHQLLALLEAPERRGERADVHGLRGDVEKMREKAADLGIEHANELAAARHFHAQHALDRHAESVLLIHRRAIVEPVEVRHVLQIGARLHQLLGAAMQQADMRIDALDDLAIELEHQAQHAVRGRMLRTKVDGEIAKGLLFGHDAHAFVAFSSPGSGG